MLYVEIKQINRNRLVNFCHLYVTVKFCMTEKVSKSVTLVGTLKKKSVNTKELVLQQ